MRRIVLSLLILISLPPLLVSRSEAVLVFSANDFSASSGGDFTTIQVRVWGPGYTAGEVAAGTIPNAAGATVGATFYTYAYRITNDLVSTNPITDFRIFMGATVIAAGSTANDGGTGTAPTGQSIPPPAVGTGWFTNTFGTNLQPGDPSEWMWVTSDHEPSLPTGFGASNNSAGGKVSETMWDFGGTGSTNLPSPNPEPATSLLFSTGLGGLAFWRRRQLGNWLKHRLRRQTNSPEGPA